jgi:hypothetical protein
MKTATYCLAIAWLMGMMSAAVPQANRAASASSAPKAPGVPPSSQPSITGYRKWTRVNPRPHWVFSQLAALCRSLTPEEQAGVAADPHEDKFVTVYVNEVARAAMLHQQKPTFPMGSVIVKEKLTSADSRTPELLTVMRKQRKGYNPRGGDWEYLVFDGTAAAVQSQGDSQRCVSCHAQWKETDYVSRAYLPDDVRRRLK